VQQYDHRRAVEGLVPEASEVGGIAVDKRYVLKRTGLTSEFQHAQRQVKANHTALLLLPELAAEQASAAPYVQNRGSLWDQIHGDLTILGLFRIDEPAASGSTIPETLVLRHGSSCSPTAR